MITSPPETDPYRSRVGGEATIVPRLDPVVYSATSADGPLDRRQVESFERDGFLFLPGFLSQAEVEEVHREGLDLASNPRLAGAEEVVLEPDSKQVRSVFRFHRFSPLMERVCSHPRLVRIVRFLLGGDVYLHQTRINYKGGFRGKEFYWHSDFETWHVEDGMPRMRAVSASLSISAGNALNGPLMVIPGSHRHYVTCVGETPAEHYKASLRKQEYGVPGDEHLEWLVGRGGIEAPVGPPGSLLLFDCNTMHGSNSNITPWPRCNLFVVFNGVSNQLHDPYGGVPPRPDYIANRTNCEPIQPAEE